MKSSFDLKHNTARLTPENPDDLWLLSDVITPGSLVTGRTLRTVEVKRDDVTVKVGRRPVALTIIVDKVELADRLRLGGRIADAPPEVEHTWHSIEVEPGAAITVQKEWKTWEVNKIRAAAKKAEPVLVCILDEREADLWLLTERPQHLLHITGRGLGKEEKTAKPAEYLGEVLAALKRNSAAVKHVLLAGPGFGWQNMRRFITEREPALLDKIVTDGLNHTGETGLQELLKRGTLERAAIASRIEVETRAVENLFVEIAREGKAAYGPEQTRQALEAGAVELLLISDRKVRELEQLLDVAERMRSKIMIVGSGHEAGQKLLGIGGIAALLRYKI